MKLKEYLEANSISQNAFAKQIDVSRSAVTQWIRDGIIPMKKHLRDIEKLTFGKVKAEDFQSK